MPAKSYDILGQIIQRYEIHLLHDAEALVGYAKGSSDEVGANAAKIIEAALEARLNDWTPSADWEKEYDDAVRNVCLKALDLYRRKG